MKQKQLHIGSSMAQQNCCRIYFSNLTLPVYQISLYNFQFALSYTQYIIASHLTNRRQELVESIINHLHCIKKAPIVDSKISCHVLTGNWSHTSTIAIGTNGFILVNEFATYVNRRTNPRRFHASGPRMIKVLYTIR